MIAMDLRVEHCWNPKVELLVIEGGQGTAVITSTKQLHVIAVFLITLSINDVYQILIILPFLVICC